jgi:hypothetical protein
VVAAFAGSGVAVLSITSAEGARACLGFSDLAGDGGAGDLPDLDMNLPHPRLNRFRGSVSSEGAGSGVSSASGTGNETELAEA